MKKNEVQYRALKVEAADAADNKLMVQGYAAVYNSPTRSGANSYEVIDSGAFNGADLSNVVFRYNHNDSDLILARTSNNTLTCTVDDNGLHIVSELAPTTSGKDVYTLIQRRDISQMSFAFTVADSYTDSYNVTHISKIGRVIDVSAVDLPAYSDTSLEIVKRDYESMLKSAKMAEIDADTRKRLYIAAKA